MCATPGQRPGLQRGRFERDAAEEGAGDLVGGAELLNAGNAKDGWRQVGDRRRKVEQQKRLDDARVADERSAAGGDARHDRAERVGGDAEVGIERDDIDRRGDAVALLRPLLWSDVLQLMFEALDEPLDVLLPDRGGTEADMRLHGFDHHAVGDLPGSESCARLLLHRRSKVNAAAVLAEPGAAAGRRRGGSQSQGVMALAAVVDDADEGDFAADCASDHDVITVAFAGLLPLRAGG